MTSKEALERLLRIACVEAGPAKEELITYAKEIEHNEKCLDLCNLIKKDLEVLNILKKWVLVNETYDDLFPYEIKLRNGYVSNRSCLVFTKDDYEKVKEWLENE